MNNFCCTPIVWNDKQNFSDIHKFVARLCDLEKKSCLQC
jgi:hypothetical protein